MTFSSIWNQKSLLLSLNLEYIYQANIEHMVVNSQCRRNITNKSKEMRYVHSLLKALCTQAMSLETKIEMIGNPSSEFFISDNELNDLLKDDADWNAEYWDFQRLGLEQFTEKLSKLYAVSNGGFTFQATWSGDKPSRIEYLSISEFLETVRSNKIGTKTKYVVAGGT